MKGLIILIILMSSVASAEDISLCKQGWAQYQYGDYEKSIGFFNQCIDKGNLSQATLAQTYRNMGIVANGSNRSEDALKFYDMGIALDPNEVWFDYVNKGNAYSALGQYEDAIKSYQMAFEVKPHFNEAHYNLGLVYDRMGNVGEAIKNYQLASEHGLNTPNLKERLNHHSIHLKKIPQLTGISKQTNTKSFRPVQEIKQVSTLDSFTCQSFVGRGVKAHPDADLIKNTMSYTFKDYGIDFNLPDLPLSHYTIAEHLNNTERNVKDSYLLFTNDLLGVINAAVVLTEFPKHLQDQSQLMTLTKRIEKSLFGAFNPSQILIRELDSDFGKIIELMVPNRGPSPCFPTSEFKKSTAERETMGISRFIYRDNMMIEMALIVEKPSHISDVGFSAYSRQQMDSFWSGLSFK